MVEGRYYRLSPKFWSDPMVIGWDDDTRLLALYLLTCPHRTTEGLFRLPRLYALADLGWSTERFDEGFRRLQDDGFIEWDPAAQVVLIVKALQWQSPDNPNMVKAALRQLAMVPETPLKARFRQLAERFCERLAEGLPGGFGEGSGDPLPQSPAPPQPPEDPPSPPAGADPDEHDKDLPEFTKDVHELTREFAVGVRANGHPIPAKGSKSRDSWLVEMDRLLRLGPPGEGGHVPDADEVRQVIRFVLDDEFEKANLQSVPKLRKRYSQLRLKALNGARASPPPGAVDRHKTGSF